LGHFLKPEKEKTMNLSEAARTGRAIKLMEYDAILKKLVEKTNWLELQPNGFLLDIETGNQFYPEAHDLKSDNWIVEQETVKVSAKQVMEIFKGYMFGINKKELITITDGVSTQDLAGDFVRKFDFKDLPEIPVVENDNEF
jgi:hypothetical protein